MIKSTQSIVSATGSNTLEATVDGAHVTLTIEDHVGICYNFTFKTIDDFLLFSSRVVAISYESAIKE